MHALFWFENLKGRDHSEELGVDGRKLLERIVGRYDGKVRTGCIWLNDGPVASSCEGGNELSGSIKGGEFLDYLSDGLFLRKDSAPLVS
jgi:hypothetical protein